VVKESKGKSEQVEDKPGRRQFQPEYKLRILQEIDTNRGTRGAIGDILRREGLYASQVAMWKRELETQLAEGIKARKRGPKADPTIALKKDIDRLARQNLRLKEDLRRARLIIDAQKKIAEMFPEPSMEEIQEQIGSGV
jgi:transposase-like protein